MMGAKLVESKNSTPKLSLSKLPCKPRESVQLLTPPLHPSLSIPFRWEEAPGKPRVEGSPPGNKVVRCLDLPPRLIDAKITTMPSPSTVLDGPYVGRSMSLACTFSFRKGRVGEGFGTEKKGGSARFEEEEEKSRKGNFDISRRSLGDILKCERNVKITGGGRRRRSFFNLSTVNSNMMGIYENLKGAVRWRRKR